MNLSLKLLLIHYVTGPQHCEDVAQDCGEKFPTDQGGAHVHHHGWTVYVQFALGSGLAGYKQPRCWDAHALITSEPCPRAARPEIPSSPQTRDSRVNGTRVVQ